MTEEYGHIPDAFDMLPEEELLMPEQERKALEALDKLYKENGDAMTKLAKIEMTEEQITMLRRLIKDEIECAQIDGFEHGQWGWAEKQLDEGWKAFRESFND
jgi:hypothetical protein